MKKKILDWLLAPDEPAIRHLALTELLEKPAPDPDVQATKAAMKEKGWIASLFKEQLPEGYWYSYLSLYRPKYVATMWRALVLADLGVTAQELGMKKACELFLTNWAREDGGFGSRPAEADSPKSYPSHFCITGNLARTLIRCGYEDDPQVRSALDWIVKAQKEDGGWHCFPSKRGTLDCWEGLSAFAVFPRAKWTRRIKRSVERGAEFYLERKLHREGGRRYEPWFRVHYPVHYYYDLLVGLDTLTALGYGDDRRIRLALELLRNKRRPDGSWALDAVHPDIAPDDPYQMKPPYVLQPPLAWALEWVNEPSKMITLRALRVLKRVDRNLPTN